MSAESSVLLIDDHGLVRHGLQLLIHETVPGMQVQAVGSLAEALLLLQRNGRFDLALLDLALGDVHGMAGLQRLRDAYPALPIVIVSAQDDRDTVLAALDAGAMGFISKAAAPEDLRVALVRVLANGGIHVPDSMTQRPAAVQGTGGKALSELAALGLTQRQVEVLGYVVQGWSNKEIARRLDRSEVVVKKHVTAALQALGVPNRTRAVLALSERGYRLGSKRDA